MFGETILSELFGNAVRSIATDQTDPLTSSIMRWVADVQGHILRRWRVVIVRGAVCSLRPRSPFTGRFEPCGAPAIGVCGCCGQPVCLGHSLIGQTADILCTACLSDYVRVVAMRGGASRPEPVARPVNGADVVDEQILRKRYLRTLGLKEPTSWEEIREAFRKKALRWHPDRAKPGKRAEAEAKFKTINEAYSWLRPRYERAA